MSTSKFRIGVSRPSGTNLLCNYFCGAGITAPSAEEAVNLRGHTLAASGLCLADTLTQSA